MIKLRPVSEDQVVLEFLRNEFHHHDFDRDRRRFTDVVEHPDVSDPCQNQVRRSLFYRRRGHMWNQLPRDTRWWHVALEEPDLDRLCVLARTHWRKIGGGNCRLRHVVERIRLHDFRGVRIVGGTAHGGIEISDVGAKVDAIRAFSESLRNQDDRSAVVLIGIDDLKPVTILEGNHRLTAALLASPVLLKKQYCVFFGASPAMARCCWYGTPTVANQLRYAVNRLRHFGNPEARIVHGAAEFMPPNDGAALVPAHQNTGPK